MRRRHAELQLDPAHALEDALDHDPLAGQQVADDAERGQHDRGVEQHRAEDQRLDVAGAVAVDVGDEEAPKRIERRDEARCAASSMNTRSGSYWA